MKDKEIKEFIRKSFNHGHSGRHYLLMLFQTEMELGISTTPNRWECINLLYFTNGQRALDAYANIPNPASQLVDGLSEEELTLEAMKVYHGMKDKKWLDENLYPYL